MPTLRRLGATATHSSGNGVPAPSQRAAVIGPNRTDECAAVISGNDRRPPVRGSISTQTKAGERRLRARVDGCRCGPHHYRVRNIDEASVFAELVRRLSFDFDALRSEDISKLVTTEVARFEQSPIREFVPLFVERRVRAQLTTLEPALSYS